MVAGVFLLSAVATPVEAATDWKPKWVAWNKVKWTKQVPGYATTVKFGEKWPVGGLVAGHRAQKAPLLLDLGITAAKEGSLLISGGGALKYVYWVYGAAQAGNKFGTMLPLGICRPTKGNYKGRIGVFDPDTGFADLAKVSCHVPSGSGALSSDRQTTIDLVKDYEVLVAPPNIAHWIDQSDAAMDSQWWKANNFIKGEQVCRFTDADEKDQAINWLKKNVNTLNAQTSIPKLKASFDLVIGQVRKIKGKNVCVGGSKSWIELGYRKLKVASKFQVLLVVPDSTIFKNKRSARNQLLTLRNPQSKICMAVTPGGMVLASCTGPLNIKEKKAGVRLEPFSFNAAGQLRVGADQKSCLYAVGANTGKRVKIDKCTLDPTTSFYLDKDKRLRTAGGRCIGLTTGNMPSGRAPAIHYSCVGKPSPVQIWEPVQYGTVHVATKSKIFAQMSVDGVSSTIFKCLKEKNGCVIHRPAGSKLKLHVTPLGSATQPNLHEKFGKWLSGGGCKGTKDTCVVAVKPGRELIGFTMASMFSPAKLAAQFQIKQGKNCLTATGTSGRPKLSACENGNPAQIFQSTFSKKSGWIRAAFMGNPTCLYHEEGPTKNGAYGMAVGKGLIQGKCHGSQTPKNTGRPKFSFEASGQIRPNTWKHCLQPKGKAVIYAPCNTKSKAQKWVFAAVKPPTVGDLMQVRASGRCLDNTGSAKKGAQMHQWSCVKKTANQRFQLVPTKGKVKNSFLIKSVKSGLCLDAKSAGKKNGTPVIQWDCHGKPNQIWHRPPKVKGGWQMWVNENAGRCLDLAGGGMGNRAKFQIWACNTANLNQHFRVVTTIADSKLAAFLKSQQSSIRAGTRTLQARYSGKCIDNTNSKNKGAQPHQWSCNKKLPAQQFQIIHVGNGDYRIKSKRSGMCLDVAGGSKKNGAKVIQWPCHKKANQKWWFYDQGNGYNEIRPRHAKNLCLDVKGPSKENRAKIQVWKCVKKAQQQFREFR